jgi:signal transduction histidine kinase
MNRGNIVSGPSFQTALVALAMFLMVLLALGSLIYENLNSTLYDNLDRRIRESVEILSDVYKSDGRDDVVAAVKSMAQMRAGLQNDVIALTDASGQRLAGNLLETGLGPGWSSHELVSPQTGALTSYRILTVDLGTDRLSLGQSTLGADKVSERIVWALLVAGLVVSAATFIVGYQSSSTVYRKLENIATVMENVASGDSKSRLPIDRANDQIDRMARQVNGHLDLLGRQTATTRNTIAAIAHDLRTPLNRVFLQLQEIQTAAAGDQAIVALARKSTEEIANLENVFETILRISRIETASGNDNMLPLSLADLAVELAETFEPVVEAAGQTMILRREDHGDHMIVGDRRMLAQMLVNLIENASRYSPAGADITLAVFGEGGKVALRVSDNGPGIPQECRDAVLEPFYRLDTSRSTPGTGLGLALVRAIVMRHGAKIELSDNKPGLGATVVFDPAMPAR